MLVGEERQQGKNCDNVELDLIVDHPFRQGMQPEEEYPYAQHCPN